MIKKKPKILVLNGKPLSRPQPLRKKYQNLVYDLALYEPLLDN